MNDIELLYESVLITEMDQKVIQYIDDNKGTLLPFDNIFGDKMRLVIPMLGSEILSELIKDIRDINGFINLDVETQEVVRSVKLDPKYGKGDKREQRIKLGKAIQGLKIPDDRKKKYLDWYALYKDSLKDMDIKDQYVIVLSRSPIDIVRMSDHRNISSCHSRGGSYFSCAIEEAINGGAIAYLVYKDSLKGLDESEFEEEDLFSDTDRGIRKVEPPLARLRIRNLTSDVDRREAAIPEESIYGRYEIPGFYESVVAFLREKQPNITPDFFTYAPLTLHGGSYEDTYTLSLINKYLGLIGVDKLLRRQVEISSDHGVDERERSHAKLGENIADELQEIHDRYDFDEDIVAHWHVIDDGDNDMYDMWADVRLPLYNMKIAPNFEIDNFETHDIRKEINSGSDLGTFLEGLKEILDGYDLYIRQVEADTKELTLVLMGHQYDELHFDTEKYTNFCDNLYKMDYNWAGIIHQIEDALIESGFIEENTSQYSRIREYMLTDELPWKHLHISGSKPNDFVVDFIKGNLLHRQDIVILKLNSAFINEIDRFMIQDPTFLNRVKDAVWNFSVANFKPAVKSNEEQLKFSTFFESFVNNDWVDDLNYKRFDFNLMKNGELSTYHPNSILIQTFRITPKNWTNLIMEYFDFIDNNYDIIINLVRYVVIDYFLNIFKNDEKMTTAILRVSANHINMRNLFSKYITGPEITYQPDRI